MENLQHLEINIKGMTCTACALRLEKVLNKIPEIKATVSFATEKAVISSAENVNLEQILGVIDSAGFGGETITSQKPTTTMDNNTNWKVLASSGEFRQFLGAALFSAPLLLPMIPMLWRFWEKLNTTEIHNSFHLPAFQQFILASIVQFVFGRRFYNSGWKAFRAGASNMDTLVALGTTSAYLLSTAVWVFNINFVGLYYEASAGIITFILLGKYLEARAKKSSQAALNSLINLKPAIAQKIIAERDSKNIKTEDYAVEKLIIGDRVLIRSGESIPTDGVIIQGNANIDEAMLTGESLPINKTVGDKVFCATINTDGLLVVEVSQVSEHSLFANIIKMVANAQGSKAQIQKFADKIAEIFVPTVIGISALTFAGWLIAGHFGYFSFPSLVPTTTNIILMAIINATTVLVIACPCAVGLATPMAIVVAIGKAAQMGILVRDFSVFEMLIKISRVVFDKTGTLTVGKPKLTKINLFNNSDENTILKIVGALEQSSHHPLASAVLAEIAKRDIKISFAEKIINNPGLGIEGVVDGVLYLCGSHRFIQERRININKNNTLDASSSAILYLADDKNILASIYFADTLRTSSINTINGWHKRRIKTSILSGDRQESVLAIFPVQVQQQIKTHGEIASELLPQDKLAKIREYQKNGERVVMVGDGINDAPALALADVGIAIGAGSESAINTADIALLQNDPQHTLQVFDLAHASFRTIKRNLFFAFIFNALGIPLASLGYINPLVAGIMMALSSLTVVTSSLFLKLWQAK